MRSNSTGRHFFVAAGIALAGLCSTGTMAQVRNNFMSDTTVSKLTVERTFLYVPGKTWFYSHHPYITFFKNKLIACWSNGISEEDKPGQRILIAHSTDFYNWSTPAVLANPSVYRHDSLNVLTAAGFHQFSDTLVVYYGQYSPFYNDTRLMARISTDGENWGEAMDLHIPVIPNHSPQKLLSGRLLITGNFCFPYTDDYRGLSGWKLSSFYPRSAYTEDNGAHFAALAAQYGIAPVCEGSFFQTDDSVIHLLLRTTGSGGPSWKGKLWLTESTDNGESWRLPAETPFTDNDTKFHFGRLPDGRYYYTGSPDTIHLYARTPLVISLSENGSYFNRNYIVADEPYQLKQHAALIGNEYGYPRTLVHDGYMYIIISRKKEAIEVIRFRLDQLK